MKQLATMKQVEQLQTHSGHSQKGQSHLLKNGLFRLGYCIPEKNPNRGSRRGLKDIFVKKTLEYWRYCTFVPPFFIDDSGAEFQAD